MKRTVAMIAMLAAATVIGLFLVQPASADGSSAIPATPSSPAPAAVTPAQAVSIGQVEADRQSTLVAQEDRRLQDIRTVSTLARWQNRAQKVPYRLSTPGGYTLVLTPRSAAYSFADLLALEPQTLVRLSDGSYLLREHIVVMGGAELNLLPTSALTLRLASSSEGFVSIVSLGGRLTMVGTRTRPITITSWDDNTATDDLDTTDGRAYLRALGGQLQMSYVNISDLGFWSGRTGGVSLTGTDRPNTGSLNTDTVKASSTAGTPELPGGGSTVGDSRVLPAGKLPTGSMTTAEGSGDSPLSYVSARIDNTTMTGNAFGLFVSGADGVDIDSSTFTRSQITGVDFHRFVRSSVIERSTSSFSGGDGFSLGRATQGVQINQSTAIGNAHDGFTSSGAPLADGPSAVGSTTQRYGNNSIVNSTANSNGHYGIAVRDGFNITVANNRVSNSVMGIVANEDASNVSVTGNQVSGVASHGVALLDGVTASTVTGNVVTDAPIYLRNASAKVQGNTIVDASGHAVSVVGSTAGTVIAYNVVAGSGSSAIDTARATSSVSQTGNVADGWRNTTSILTRVMHALLQPMTLLWAAIVLLVIGSMIGGIRRGGTTRGTHPYAHQRAHLHPAQA